MLFRHKIDRGLEIMREKNRRYLDSVNAGNREVPETLSPEEELADAERKAQEFHKEEKLELEKGDMLAIILSAFLTFGPILLILGAGIAAAWLFLH